MRLEPVPDMFQALPACRVALAAPCRRVAENGVPSGPRRLAALQPLISRARRSISLTPGSMAVSRMVA